MLVQNATHSGHMADSGEAPESIEEIRAVLSESPAIGLPVEMAPGVWLVRLPLTASMDHVNIYVLDDDNGWTVIDTGNNTPECRAIIDELFLRGPFSTKPVSRVLATHYHNDHVGLVGHIAEFGAEFWATRTCWLTARLLQMDQRTVPCEKEIRFLQRASLGAMELAAYRRNSPSNYSKQVLPLPFAYHRLIDNDVVTIGDRTWRIHCGNGHASEHATLWSDDGLAIVGDQILPGISSNLSVHPSEPEADLVSEWIDSCRKMAALADENTLCLPGHGIPFVGIRKRCEQLITSQTSVLRRLLEFLQRPATVVDCLPTLYRRALQPGERPALIQETVGFLNYLCRQQLVHRETMPNDTFLFSRCSSSLPDDSLLSKSATTLSVTVLP